MPAPGLVAIAGGKYTTYRVMAADAIDAAAQFIPARVAPSITEKVSLLGADGYFALINQAEHVAELQGLHPYRVRHLLDRYGSLIGDVLALADDRPDLLDPIKEAPGYLRVEALYAVTAEGPCIWRMSWPAGCASPSNTRTAVWTAPARSRMWLRRC